MLKDSVYCNITTIVVQSSVDSFMNRSRSTPPCLARSSGGGVGNVG